MEINQKICFADEDIFDILSEILDKNGIKETIDDIWEEDTKESKIIITLDAIEDLISQRISEKDFNVLLQNKLAVSEKASENILKDAKKKIFPLAEKISNQTAGKRQMDIKPINPIKERQKTQQETFIPSKKLEYKPRPVVQSPAKDINKPSGKTDSYRESIE